MTCTTCCRVLLALLLLPLLAACNQEGESERSLPSPPAATATGVTTGGVAAVTPRSTMVEAGSTPEATGAPGTATPGTGTGLSSAARGSEESDGPEGPEGLLGRLQDTLNTGDPAPLESVIGPEIWYGTYRRDALTPWTRDHFLQEMRAHLSMPASCAGYFLDGDATAYVLTRGWAPGWDADGGTSSALVLEVRREGEGWRLAGAYPLPEGEPEDTFVTPCPG